MSFAGSVSKFNMQNGKAIPIKKGKVRKMGALVNSNSMVGLDLVDLMSWKLRTTVAKGLDFNRIANSFHPFPQGNMENVFC